MLLKRIKKIKGFGIMDDFNPGAELQEFSKFNLVYGWNGSGKTTFTRLLNCLNSKIACPSFPSGEFELLTDGTSVKHTTLSNFTSPCFVFNQQFIEDNIDWKKQGAKSIIVISEEKIDERKRFIELRDKLIPLAEEKYNLAKIKLQASEKEADDFYIALARSIKQSFQVIDTSDRHYFNYDKAKLKSFITNNAEKINQLTSILSEEALKELHQKVRPLQRPEIKWALPVLPKAQLLEGEKRIVNLLQTSIINKSIKKLESNPELNAWVQEGLNIHSKLEASQCEFCTQPLPEGRLKELESHFNKEYAALMDKLHKAKEWIQNQQLKSVLADASELYDEFQQSYKEAVNTVTKAEQAIDEYLKSIETNVNNKLANPFETGFKVEEKMQEYVTALEEAFFGIESILKLHNTKTQNFEADLKQFKHTLELHYVATAAKEKNFAVLNDKITKEQEAANKLGAAAEKLKSERVILEASLANVAKGAEDFNKDLQSFLGRKDIYLEYDSKEKGYRIKRTTGGTNAENLSEGEKTAIAFIYFMTKICENGNKVEDSVVIIDDPISSFDANHLFHSLSFLKRKCEKVLQLFILTHNFNYFKLVRDWLMNKNKAGNIKSSLFAIEVAKGASRRSIIVNANKCLEKFGSEYQYLFKKLLEYKEDHQLDVEGAYQVANYSRKLLEGFFKFKHPKERDNFYQLMEAGCKAGNVDDATFDKVYKFINKYSHNDSFDFHESPVDNLLGEGENITSLVLEIVEKCDKVHYDELMELSAL